jgi:hypothetical protein
VAAKTSTYLSMSTKAMSKRYVRGLEALRRVGIAERIHADHWHVPKDF